MKRIISYITAAAAVLGLSGCQDFLTKAPVLSQSDDLTLSTYDGLDKSVAGAYIYISYSTWYGQEWIIDGEMRSGNGIKDRVRDSNRCTQPYNWNYTPDNTSGLWAYCYYLTAAVNNVLDNLDGKDKDGVTQQDLDNLKAECLFLRAFAHFHCVITYGQPYTYAPDSPGVPVVLHTDPNYRPERKTVAQVYGQVLEDLLEAEKTIDPGYVRPGGEDINASVNINVIRAFLSRVYLYMGNWQKAADYATAVIDSGAYTMWSAEEYPTVWGDDTGSGEVIFEVYGKRTNDSYASWEDLSYLTSPQGSGDPMASTELLGLYEDGDARLLTYRTDAAAETGRFWTGKYPGKGDNAAPDCNNVVILRLSEMYLNRAEAAVNGAQTGSTAIADLNAITSKRNATAYTSVGINDIQTERRKELAWEGHYLHDLARWSKPLVRNEFPLGSMNQNVSFPDYRWALPIAQRELIANPSLEQNEGYEKQ